MKARTFLLQLLVTAIVAGFATGASAAMYKWKDKAGNIHYTQEPPPEGDAAEIAPPPRVSAPPVANEATAAEAGDKKGEQAKNVEPPNPEKQAVYMRNCEAAKKNLEIAKTSERIKQANGEIIVMDPEKRQTKINQAEEQIKKYCN